jgi:WhiB family transcriptional regulator, redox-sensing transcriptional regulator
MDTPKEQAWMASARCRGVNPEEFFPTGTIGVEAAQRVCAECPVRVECLEYALAERIDQGVWGGASQRERRRILRRRRAEAARSGGSTETDAESNAETNADRSVPVHEVTGAG